MSAAVPTPNTRNKKTKTQRQTLWLRHNRTAMMRQLTAIAAMVMTGPQPTRGIFASTSVTPASFLDTVVERFGSRYRPGKRHRGNRGRTDMWRFGFPRSDPRPHGCTHLGGLWGGTWAS